MRRRTENTIAACRRFSEFIKNDQALPNQEESNAVKLDECCRSFHAHNIDHIAQSDHFVHLTSFVLDVGNIAFLRGITSSLFALGLSIHVLKN